MNKPENSSNFWSGFAAGAIGGSVILYMFATKRGRKTLHSLLEGAETVEHDIEGIFELLQNSSLFSKEEKEPQE